MFKTGGRAIGQTRRKVHFDVCTPQAAALQLNASVPLKRQNPSFLHIFFLTHGSPREGSGGEG